MSKKKPARKTPPSKPAKKPVKPVAAKKAAPAPKRVAKPPPKPVAAKRPKPAPTKPKTKPVQKKQAASTVSKPQQKPAPKPAAVKAPKQASIPSGKPIQKQVKPNPTSKGSNPAPGKPKAPTASAPSAPSKADKRRKVPVAAPRVAFSLEEALELARSVPAKAAPAPAADSPIVKVDAAKPAKTTATKRKIEDAPVKIEARKLGAASLADILGFDPKKGVDPEKDEAAKIPEKWTRYYKLLVELRRHIKEGLTLHSEETLMKSAKDDAGDLSGYSQHMADAGTDTFDRDFALSVVANEQEALNEIEGAVKRMLNGTYGVCELTGKPIAKERLLAVPFARYSVESQTEVEKLRRQRAARGVGLVEFEDEEGAPTPAAGGGGDEDAGED
jgi:RNA polymerase-binding transcription factor DksA